MASPVPCPSRPSVPSSPRVPTPAPSTTEAPDPSIHLSLPHRMKASSDQAPDPALAWTSIPASIPTAIHHQPAPISYPRSYPHLPQWERISSLRSDYATNALAVQASSLEIHARDYRAGILLLSLLDVLRDRKKYIDARTMELRKLAWNVAEMKEIGCSWREMGITEAHASANEFFKSIWGCEFEDINLAEDGTISGDWLRLKEDGTSGASLPVGHMPSYPDGVHLPSMEHLIGIPMRRADGKMGEFDIQKMGNAFAQAPFEVLKGLVRGVDGSRYAPLEI
ncbi:hypothetical protein NMY22_g3834 [Coprinellus aureogranulatus]|nr:hypothetical protein NMY22_g3834 [Coprinellus aureogranulatus]